MAQRESQSDTTIDHDEIRRWAEERDGTPATVKGTGKKNDAGILRLDFEPKDEELEEISWDEFFDKFDKEKLAFLYQEQTADGKVSRFHKFVQRQAGAKTSSGSKSSSTAKSSKSDSGAQKSAASSKRGSAGTQKTGAKQASTGSKSSRQTQSEPKKRAGSKKS